MRRILTPLRWIVSLIFIVQMYLSMAVLLVFIPVVLVRPDTASLACRTYCLWVRWSAARLVGLRSEVRGAVPEGEVIIASKHQSFFDIILIFSVVARPRFIMKKELLRVPILSFYARRIGCIAVDRGKRGQAIRQMVADVRAADGAPGPLVIFPQGTRVAAEARMPYKAGAGILYKELALPCVPAATNVGVFWPRRGVMRHSGLAVLEFLPAIAPGRSVSSFMGEVEARIEDASDALMREAGFSVPLRVAVPLIQERDRGLDR